jgi:hypothetical protein
MNLVEDEVAKKPWTKYLDDDKSDIYKIILNSPLTFTKRLKVLIDIANKL